jgi:hypothetical protein
MNTAQVKEILTRIQGACLGFAKIDIVENKERLHFGKYNDRLLDAAKLAKMKKSLWEEGVQWYLAHAFMAVLAPDPSYVDVSKLSVNSNLGVDLPELEWTEKGEGMGMIEMASGQH